MKKEVIIGIQIIFMIIITNLASCNNEEDYIINEDLSITSQVSKTRSGADQAFYPDYNSFGYGDNECCLIALVELKRNTMENHSFNEEFTASQCYDKFRLKAMEIKDDSGNQLYFGGKMDLEVFERLGKEESLLRERMHFTSESERNEYLSDKKNEPKVLHIDVWNEVTNQMESHVARVVSISRKSKKITYSVKGGSPKTISFSEVKDIWY